MKNEALSDENSRLRSEIQVLRAALSDISRERHHNKVAPAVRSSPDFENKRERLQHQVEVGLFPAAKGPARRPITRPIEVRTFASFFETKPLEECSEIRCRPFEPSSTAPELRPRASVLAEELLQIKRETSQLQLKLQQLTQQVPGRPRTPMVRTGCVEKQKHCGRCDYLLSRGRSTRTCGRHL